MSANQNGRKAEPVAIEHTGRTANALEWSTPGSISTVLVAVEGDVAELVSPVAENLMDRFRVIGVNLESSWDPVTVAWWAADPVVLVAQGTQANTACETALLAPGAVKALVLAEASDDIDTETVSSIAISTLVFRGRQSESQSHEAAVDLHQAISGSHLIELDGCGDQPTKNCPTALAESLTWYLGELGKPHIEFSDFSGANEEPVDPKG